MSPYFYSLHPAALFLDASLLEPLVSGPQFTQAVIVLLWAGFLGAFLATWLGAMWGRFSYDFLFLFIRRSPRWRRFERAMSRYFRGL